MSVPGSDDGLSLGVLAGTSDRLQITVPVAGRLVLVMGSGPSAAATAAALLDRAAVVRLVATAQCDLTPALADLVARGRVQLWPRAYAPDALQDVWLAYPRSDDVLDNLQVSDDAFRARVWVVPVAAERRRRHGAGRVTIVGGGPGDAGLITVRGLEALQQADVVVHDRLAPLGLLAELPPDTLLIDAAKIPGGRAMPQEQINTHLIRHAEAGAHVVRLKGGDPFVFGRGLEEVLACREAGVPVEVVPGVTSAVSVPGLAGISLTHRGEAQSFTVVSGHLAPSSQASHIDWAALARSGSTLVLLMAVETLPEIVATLMAAGMDPATPAASVQEGATCRQRVVLSRLDSLVADTASIRPPAVTVIGSVVGHLPEQLTAPLADSANVGPR